MHTAAECEPNQVCHPFTMECVIPGDTCTAQGDCPENFYCDADDGVCLVGTAGAPCETDANCQDMCVNNVCSCTGLAHERELMGGPLDIYFVFDRTADARVLKCLTIVDDATHESVGIEVERAISGTGVTRVLDRLAIIRGLPKTIRTDNGKEFCGKAMVS